MPDIHRGDQGLEVFIRLVPENLDVLAEPERLGLAVAPPPGNPGRRRS